MNEQKQHDWALLRDLGKRMDQANERKQQEITVNMGGIGKLTRGTVETGSPDWWWVRSIQFREALTTLAREYGMHLAADDDFLVVRRHDGQVLTRNLEWDETEQEYMNGYTPREVQPCE